MHFRNRRSKKLSKERKLEKSNGYKELKREVRNNSALLYLRVEKERASNAQQCAYPIFFCKRHSEVVPDLDVPNISLADIEDDTIEGEMSESEEFMDT